MADDAYKPLCAHEEWSWGGIDLAKQTVTIRCVECGHEERLPIEWEAGEDGRLYMVFQADVAEKYVSTVVHLSPGLDDP